MPPTMPPTMTCEHKLVTEHVRHLIDGNDEEMKKM
jgi:hypothetical protein